MRLDELQKAPRTSVAGLDRSVASSRADKF
jgi:hypothetical protein